MTVADIPLRIAHLASIHCGEVTHSRELMRDTVDRVNAVRPDLVLFAGDLTAAGYEWEYEQAIAWLALFDAPAIVVPGNHDSRNVGYIHYERHYGERFSRHRLAFDGERAERVRATGVTVVAVDSSQPDVDDGHIGREWYGWIRESFDEPDDLKVFLLHHHLIAVPGSGRAMNLITDAGDLLPILTGIGVDVVLSGHKHVPYFWGLNGMLVCNAGTAATRRVRGTVRPSWNELRIDASTIKVLLHYDDGRRELSAIRSRTTRAMIREAFTLTDAFRRSNQILGI